MIFLQLLDDYGIITKPVTQVSMTTNRVDRDIRKFSFIPLKNFHFLFRFFGNKLEKKNENNQITKNTAIKITTGTAAEIKATSRQANNDPSEKIDTKPKAAANGMMTIKLLRIDSSLK